MCYKLGKVQFVHALQKLIKIINKFVVGYLNQTAVRVFVVDELKVGMLCTAKTAQLVDQDLAHSSVVCVQ